MSTLPDCPLVEHGAIPEGEGFCEVAGVDGWGILKVVVVPDEPTFPDGIPLTGAFDVDDGLVVQEPKQ